MSKSIQRSKRMTKRCNFTAGKENVLRTEGRSIVAFSDSLNREVEQNEDL